MARYRRILLEDAGGRAGPTDEHTRALDREQQWIRTSRAQLGQEARQHHQVLAQIRESVARDRHLHRSALRDNRWLVALAEAILRRTREQR